MSGRPQEMEKFAPGSLSLFGMLPQVMYVLAGADQLPSLTFIDNVTIFSTYDWHYALKFEKKCDFRKSSALLHSTVPVRQVYNLKR